MSLVPWKPSKNRSLATDWDTLEDHMTRLFQFPIFRWPDLTTDSFNGSWTPAIDVVESKKDYHIKADLPGLKKEDVHISVDNDVLNIAGERKNEVETKEDGTIRTERTYGSFYRSFTLPKNVDASKIKASYKEGVLELTVPKDEKSQSRQIEVELD